MLAPPRSPEPPARPPEAAPLPLTRAVWPSGLPEALHLPIALLPQLRLNPEQFAEFCAFNPDAVLELAANGSLILMTPSGSETGARNSALNALLWEAVKRSGLPLKLFGSSSGFRLPDQSVLSPDASLVALERFRQLTGPHEGGAEHDLTGEQTV